MIIPARGKVLVEVYSQKHSLIHLPETVTLPELSVAEIVNGNGNFPKGQLVLIPTKAGLNINEGGIIVRLVNESDVVAEIGG
ncbi:hypothetical protein LCGC14_0442510 [marine sediment metagenome]|uniref:Uncharacterized protein n=1 Tax=marine sediment metagenome TaxID=412755 RepID=A0A0F9V6U9_9ZZZZ